MKALQTRFFAGKFRTVHKYGDAVFRNSIICSLGPVADGIDQPGFDEKG